jgi:hypothetical protein
VQGTDKALASNSVAETTMGGKSKNPYSDFNYRNDTMFVPYLTVLILVAVQLDEMNIHHFFAIFYSEEKDSKSNDLVQF